MAEQKVSMEKDPKDSEPSEASGTGNDDKYPYGLRISLGHEELKKLGITSLPTVGAKMCIDADVSVIAVRSEEEAEGGVENHVELQITSMTFCGPAEGKRDASEVLYGQ